LLKENQEIYQGGDIDCQKNNIHMNKILFVLV